MSPNLHSPTFQIIAQHCISGGGGNITTESSSAGERNSLCHLIKRHVDSRERAGSDSFFPGESFILRCQQPCYQARLPGKPVLPFRLHRSVRDWKMQPYHSWVRDTFCIVKCCWSKVLSTIQRIPAWKGSELVSEGTNCDEMLLSCEST